MNNPHTGPRQSAERDLLSAQQRLRAARNEAAARMAQNEVDRLERKVKDLKQREENWDRQH